MHGCALVVGPHTGPKWSIRDHKPWGLLNYTGSDGANTSEWAPPLDSKNKKMVYYKTGGSVVQQKMITKKMRAVCVSARVRLSRNVIL